MPHDLPKVESTKQVLAQQVADSIAELLNSREVLHTTKHQVDAGDIMILLRARTLMPAIIVALDAKGLPHTGADQMDLNQDPIVDDLLQLMRLSCF